MKPMDYFFNIEKPGRPPYLLQNEIDLAAESFGVNSKTSAG